MIKIVTVIGTRPQFVKGAALSRAIHTHFTDEIQEILVHTGQHYDRNMSEVFFDELEIPQPDYNLEAGSGSHGRQTARMIKGIEQVLHKENPKALILYGDTNSTLAGALAASKIHIPVVHIEAGLRSFNKNMPEEINRIVCDHCSTLLFTPTKTGMNNLIKEGFQLHTAPPYSIDNPRIVHCGDIMYDQAIHYADRIISKSALLQKLHLECGQYLLATIHRESSTVNTDDLKEIFEAFLEITSLKGQKIVVPLHPRTSKALKKHIPEKLLHEIESNEHILLIPPVSYLEMLLLEKNARIILTDSGGVQKEAYYFSRPGIILRNETEWDEIIQAGAGILTGTSKNRIIAAYEDFMDSPEAVYPPVFGDGHAAEVMCKEILEVFNTK